MTGVRELSIESVAKRVSVNTELGSRNRSRQRIGGSAQRKNSPHCFPSTCYSPTGVADSVQDRRDVGGGSERILRCRGEIRQAPVIRDNPFLNFRGLYTTRSPDLPPHRSTDRHSMRVPGAGCRCEREWSLERSRDEDRSVRRRVRFCKLHDSECIFGGRFP